MPRYCLNDASSICEGLYGLPDLKVKLPNTTWVQDPLIVNSAGIMCENTMPRDQDFEPAVFVSLFLYFFFICLFFLSHISFTFYHLTHLLSSLTSLINQSHTLTDQPSHPNMEQAGHSEEDGFYEAQQNLSTGSLQQLRTINQEPARGTEYLKYFRDVRSTQEERLVIEEGSVVISIPPSFTGLPQQIIAPDEFEFRLGEVFVVCRMFADMWALCARVRNSQCIADTKEEDLHKSPNIKFLPLCCVTLASNFAPFTRRWALYRQQHPYGHVFPSGGNCITPPDRVESLEASRRYSTQRSPIPLHPMVYTLCATPKRMPADIDWVAQDDQTTELQQNENKQSTNATNGKSTAQKGTFGRVWKRFATKDTEKVTKAEKQLGLGQDGRTSYPVRSREDVPDAPEGTDGTDGTDGENTPINRNEEEKRISNRNSVRNFFTRSGRGKNGEGSGSTSQV